MIAQRIRTIKEKMAVAAAKAGRLPMDVTLVAVSKHFPAEVIKEAVAAGQMHFGENYIQELREKKALVPPDVVFHFIGHLQSNKAKIAVETCNMIETVDSFKLGKALNSSLEHLDKKIDILVQVNIGKDTNKTGADSDKTEELLIQLHTLPRLRICGLMTIPPYATNPELSRPHFRNLRLLAKELIAKNLFPHVEKVALSMGMSEDYQIAIEEGATIVRVGTAIFGQRK